MNDYMTNYIIIQRELWGKLSYFFNKQITAIQIDKHNYTKY